MGVEMFAEHVTVSTINDDALMGLLTPLDATGQPAVNQLRPGRWYDNQPTLAFALRCLVLAPLATRQAVMGQLTHMIGQPCHKAPLPAYQNPRVKLPHSRQSDDGLSGFWQTMEALKALPATQRHQTAHFILQQLNPA